MLEHELIKSPEMVELHLCRAKGQPETRLAAVDAIRAMKTVLAFAEEQG